MLKIFILNNFFKKKQKKTVIFEETAKYSSGGAFDHFFTERARLTQKINVTFFITN